MPLLYFLSQGINTRIWLLTTGYALLVMEYWLMYAASILFRAVHATADLRVTRRFGGAKLDPAAGSRFVHLFADLKSSQIKN